MRRGFSMAYFELERRDWGACLRPSFRRCEVESRGFSMVYRVSLSRVGKTVVETWDGRVGV